jgi:hypothetical protein
MYFFIWKIKIKLLALSRRVKFYISTGERLLTSQIPFCIKMVLGTETTTKQKKKHRVFEGMLQS